MLLQTFIAQKLLLIIIAKHALNTIRNPRSFIIQNSTEEFHSFSLLR